MEHPLGKASGKILRPILKAKPLKLSKLHPKQHPLPDILTGFEALNVALQ